MTLTCCQDHICSQKIYGLYGLKHHIVEMRGGVTDTGRTNNQTVKIELLSQWKLEAEFRNNRISFTVKRQKHHQRQQA